MSIESKNNYELLPFLFKQVANNEILIVNQGGDFSFISHDDFLKLINRMLDTKNEPFLKLKSQHFVADTDVELPIKLLSTKYRSRKGFLRDFTSLHMVVVTARCNCCCDYCHASSSPLDSKNMDMNWDTAKKTVDMIFRSPSPHIKIEFQGGEPLLNWDIIVDIVNYAKLKNKIHKRNLEFVICTNLILIDKQKIQFCKKNGILISTSLDGPQEIYDKHRKCRNGESGYHAFRENLKLVRQYMGYYDCSPLVTVTKSNLHRLKEVVDEYISLDFRSIFIRPLNPYGSAKAAWGSIGYPINEFVEAYKEVLEYIFSLNIKGTYFTELYASLLFRRIMTPFSTGFVDLQSPSGAGISGVIYDYNGEVYPSDEARMLARIGDKRFLLGKVNDHSYGDIFFGKVLREIINCSCVELLSGCSSCAYQIFCGADPVRNYVEFKDIYGHRPTSDFCKKNMAIFDYLFGLIRQGDDKVLDILWSWITPRGSEAIKNASN